MPNEPIPTTDHRIHTKDGGLFARAWRPGGTAADAPTILLFHDSLGSVELWRDFPAALANTTGLPVLAYDRLGFGRSTPHPGPLSVDFIEREAGKSVPMLRAQLGLERFVAFGHSVGGAMAVSAGAAFPDACVAVVTEAAQAFIEDRTLAGIRAAQARFEEPGQVERLMRYHGEKARWVLDSWIQTWLSPSFSHWTLDPELAQLRAPVLAIHGGLDEYGSRAHPERIVARAGGPTAMTLLEGCGHIPHRERPQEVLESVSSFLWAHRAVVAP